MKNDDTDVAEVAPPRAYEMLGTDDHSALLDVRSRVEFDYVGHPEGAVNIPWQEPPAWQLNPAFLEQVKQSLNDRFPGKSPEDLTIFTLCRSGGRSYDAAAFLKQNGFSRVINIAEGFEGDLDADKHRGKINGWRFHKLPWVQT